MTGDFYLEDRVGDDVGSKAGETLTPTATYSHQQHVASRLTNHSHYTTHCTRKRRENTVDTSLHCVYTMFNGISEEDKVHSHVARLHVIVLELLFHEFLQL